MKETQKTIHREGDISMNKPRKNPLIHKLTVRLDEPMYARLNDIANRSNQTIVECVRDLIVKGKISAREVQPVELPGLRELTTEFSRIGNNLNQIARYLNSGVPMDARMQASLMDCVRLLYEMKYKVDALGGEIHSHPKAHRR